MATFINQIQSQLGLTPSAPPPAQPTIPAAALNMPLSPNFIYLDNLAVAPHSVGSVYAFGDSLSDAGNISNVSLGQIPVAPYSDGRFTNGSVWVQDLAQNLGLPAVSPSLTGGTDYAYGGAQTGSTMAHSANPSDLPTQLSQFEHNTPAPAPNALYSVWAGSNDVFDIANSTLPAAQQSVAVAQAVSNEVQFINGLITHGAKDLVVLGVPDLGSTPYEQARPASQAASSTLSQQYNSELGTALQQIVAAGAANVDYVNTYALLDAAIANPSTYGLTNVTQPVWTGGLTAGSGGSLNATGAAQNGYLFFDNMHPTATGHLLLADAVTQSLTGTA
jgi:phospholipase/lecithinase/hemolysin